jgi:glycosyl hydrolase family 99
MESFTRYCELRRWQNTRAISVLLALLSLNSQAASKPVMVHFMPWFVAKPFSSSWGWHWTMNYFNPDTFNTNGRREIASWYYPQIGPYDSDDPVVLEYQVLLLKLASVDGVIVDWYGMDNYLDYAVNNQRTLALFGWTRRAGLKFSLCYEDATILNEINGGYITSNNAVAHAQKTMLYAETNFFDDPSFLRLKGRPVLLNFGPQYFTASGDWVAIFSVLAPSNSPPAFFTEDNKLAIGRGAFDWPPMGMSQTNNGTLTTNQLNAYLTQFEQKAALWGAYISSAFPRFHDVYQQAGIRPSYGYLDDNHGLTFQSTLQRAMTNSSAIAQIVTWNDYGEGTVVEPTTDYGCRDLGVLQNFRRLYLSPGYAGTTNDFLLAIRVYNARRQYAGNAIAYAELDRIFTNAVTEDLSDASLKLSGLESQSPVIYNLSLANNQLAFSVGGYVSSNGVEVQSTSDAVLSHWQTAAFLSSGSNAPSFTTNIANFSGTVFFRAANRP